MRSANTVRARYHFKVRKFPEHALWIALDPVGSDNLELGRGFLGFDLPPGTTFERANQIADFLNENITHVSLTKAKS